MAANLTTHIPIVEVSTTSGNQPRYQSINEKSAQTFLAGTPVELSAGVVRDWDGATVLRGIAGIAKIDGSNYATNGAGAPNGFSGVGPPGTTDTFGSVQNQPLAINIAHGAPSADGRTLFAQANDDTVFMAQIDNGAAGSYASAQAQIGVQYGLTKDASGYWYIDLNKITVGTNTVLTIIGFNPIQPIGTNGAEAYFVFQTSAQQMVP